MSDLIARLIEAGTPANLVAEVAKQLARAEIAQEAIETRRTKDRDRQSRRRHVMSRDITLDSVTERDKLPLSPSPLLSPQTPQTTPHPHTPTGVYIPRARLDDFPQPEWADRQHWLDFLTNRKAKKCRNTATAYAGFMRDIAKWTGDDWPPGRLLEHAAAKGWAAIYNPRESTNDRTITNIRNGSGHGHDKRTNLMRAIDEGLASL